MRFLMILCVLQYIHKFKAFGSVCKPQKYVYALCCHNNHRTRHGTAAKQHETNK